MYGGKAASRIWVEHIRKGLVSLDFIQSITDPCVLYQGNLIFLHFVDDRICLSSDAAEIDNFITDLQTAKFNVTDKGQLSDCLGVKIEKLPGEKIKLSQPHLIDQILTDLGLDLPHAHGRETDPCAVHQDHWSPHWWKPI
jgi:hypothetical protein